VSLNVGNYHYSLCNNPEERSYQMAEWLTCSTVCFLQDWPSCSLRNTNINCRLRSCSQCSTVESILLRTRPNRLRQQAALRVATNLSEESTASIFRMEVGEIQESWITKCSQVGQHGLCNETDCVLCEGNKNILIIKYIRKI